MNRGVGEEIVFQGFAQRAFSGKNLCSSFSLSHASRRAWVAAWGQRRENSGMHEVWDHQGRPPLQRLAIGQCPKYPCYWATRSPGLWVWYHKKPSKVLASSRCTVGLKKVPELETRIPGLQSYFCPFLAVWSSLLCSRAPFLLTESSWAWRDGEEYEI